LVVLVRTIANPPVMSGTGSCVAWSRDMACQVASCFFTSTKGRVSTAW
jgi:hypothetical protein